MMLSDHRKTNATCSDKIISILHVLGTCGVSQNLVKTQKEFQNQAYFCKSL